MTRAPFALLKLGNDMDKANPQICRRQLREERWNTTGTRCVHLLHFLLPSHLKAFSEAPFLFTKEPFLSENRKLLTFGVNQFPLGIFQHLLGSCLSQEAALN